LSIFDGIVTLEFQGYCVRLLTSDLNLLVGNL